MCMRDDEHEHGNPLRDLLRACASARRLGVGDGGPLAQNERKTQRWPLALSPACAQATSKKNSFSVTGVIKKKRMPVATNAGCLQLAAVVGRGVARRRVRYGCIILYCPCDIARCRFWCSFSLFV